MRVAFLALTFCACAASPYEHLPAAAPKVVPKAFVAPAGLSRLRLGLVPYMSEETMRATHSKLIAHLGKELGVEIELIVGKSYDDLGDQLARRELDLAELSPYVYVRTKEKLKLKPLVMAIADGSDTAAGYIVVRRDSALKTLLDLKGRSFGYVDPASATGYLLPRQLLREHGFTLDSDFVRAEMMGNHEAALLAVFEGRVDAAATYQGAFNALRRSKGIDPLSFRVIAKTPRSPRDLYVARDDVAPGVGEAVTRLLLDVSTRTPLGRELLSPMAINGYVRADDRAYAELERAHKLESARE